MQLPLVAEMWRLFLQDMNIYELIRGRRHYVAEDRVRSYLYQLMKSLDHMHRNGIFHRCACDSTGPTPAAVNATTGCEALSQQLQYTASAAGRVCFSTRFCAA